MPRHGDDLALTWTVEDGHDVLGPWLTRDHAGRRLLPIVAALEQLPVAIRIGVRSDVRTQRHRWVIGERLEVRGLLPHVLGHHVDGVVASREIEVEAWVGLVQVEDNRVRVGCGDIFDVQFHLGREQQAGVVHERVDREDHVVRGELDTVTPHDAMAQRHGHLHAVSAVRRSVSSQRVDPLAGVLVDVPQQVHDQSLAGRAGRTAGDKQVEIVGHAVAEDLVDHVDLLARHGDRQATAAEALRKPFGQRVKWHARSAVRDCQFEAGRGGRGCGEVQ